MFERTLGRISNMTNLKTRSNVKLGDLTGSANIVSSIEFNRCGDLFATAGVSKRIRIYNFDEAINDSIPLHLPEREISTSSKISCISWSSFQKTHIASSDYNGLVVLYDALGCTDHPVMVLEEHDKRCWSVDYSTVDPRRLASGSDDGTVKIWSTTEKRSSITIDGRANVCSVRFHPKRQDLIAFGSADHNVHLYDLRKSSTALRILKGHQKAVSYVKFTSEGEIVSASTDCSLCLWSVPGISLNNDFTVPMGNEKNKDGIVRSYKGHLNEKNFVGLSVSGDAIACGSEDNAVYVYHRELESPLAVSKFISRCPVTNSIVESAVSAASASGEGYQFVSGLAWSPRDPGILLAANSQGHIRILELCSSATDD